ncbi:MAG: endonuclease III [Bacteroidota bacterium]|nr:endonuclease III [Bacteroidota bacterium]
MPAKVKKNIAVEVIERLKKKYPEVKCFLNHSNPFELLISTILSAQCTDVRVNKVTVDLFKKYKTVQDYIDVPAAELEKDIFSLGFYSAKTKSIKNCCQYLIDNHNGKVPENFDELTKIPGVGRKTASVVAGNAFGIPSIAVDTHVIRVSNILGLVNTKDPIAIETELKAMLPEKDWINSSHYLIMHGRNTCIARRPKCNECLLADICPNYDYAAKK